MSRLLVATPFDGGDTWTARVTLGYHNFVRALEKQLGADVLDGSLLFACDVVRARNRAAAMVLREFKEHTHVLWIDDDNFPENIDDGVRVVRELLALGVGLVGVPYTNKRHPVRWVHQQLAGSVPDARGLLSVRGLGFGVTLTTTWCLEKMTRLAEHYWDLPNEHQVADIFGQLRDADAQGREYLASEDFSFCKRWRDLGENAWLYMRSGVFLHAGSRSYSARDIPGMVAP